MPPTILQVLPALDSGGVERGTVDMARAIAQAGWSALVVSAGGRMVRELEASGARHVAIPIGSKNPLDWRRNLSRLVETVLRNRVDLIHARSRMPAWIGLRAARAAGCPFVTTFHGRYSDANALKKLYNSVMCRGDRVIAISDYIAAEITRRYAIAPPRLCTIHRGIDLEAHGPDRVAGTRVAALAARWGVPKEVPVIMLPARVTRWKGHELLIDALARIPARPWHCLLVGPWDRRRGFHGRLRSRIAGLGLEGRVTFTDHCDDMPAACLLADVAVSASLDPEPFGRVIVEARVAGRRVVAGDHGGAREILADDAGGILVEPGSAAALADGIAAALDAVRASGPVVPAPARMRATYSMETMCARTIDLYGDLLTTGSTAGR